MVYGAARTWLRPPGSVTGPADLATSDGQGRGGAGAPRPPGGAGGPGRVARRYRPAQRLVRRLRAHIARDPPRDRKSTRLNSSHLVISYAVFCLKKKKPEHRPDPRLSTD